MHVLVRGALLGLLTDGVAAVGFGVGWGLVWRGCAPPSPACLLPGHACVAVCSDGWAQFPANVPFGLILGLAPAVLMFTACQVLPAPPSLSPTRWRTGLGLALAGVCLASLGMDLLFLSRGAFEGQIVPWAILALAVVSFLSGTVLLRRRPDEPSG